MHHPLTVNINLQ